jgi:hypothetical protein
MLSKLVRTAAAATVVVFGVSATAQATIATVFSAIPTGISSFDAQVVAAGGTVFTDSWNAFTTPSDRGPYTVAANSGTKTTLDDRGGYPDLTGYVAGINPDGVGVGGGIESGLTFTFDTPINSFGLEVGDWGTCCDPSGLYISFDDGAPILVGIYDGTNDVRLTDGRAEVFVAAFDDSSFFSKIQFWGDGYGEYLTAGGTIRFGAVQQGGIDNPPGPSPVPLPAAVWLLGSAVLGGGVAKRLRRKG